MIFLLSSKFRSSDLGSLGNNLSSCLFKLFFRDDGQQQARWVFLVMVDFMDRGLAAADVVGNIFRIMGARDARRHVRARNVDTDAVPLLEEVCRRQDFDGVFVYLAGHDWFLRLSGKRVPGFP